MSDQWSQGAFSVEWLMRQRFPDVRYVVPGIIPEGLSMLAASPKIGKSWLVLGLAAALANGDLVLGGIDSGQPRPVLYLALEDSPRRLQSRLRTLGIDPGASAGRFHMRTAANGKEVPTIIAEYIHGHADAAPLVILDTLGVARGDQVEQGNRPQYSLDYEAMRVYKGACDEVAGSAVIVVHHTRKQEGTDWTSKVSGTQGLAGACDSVLLLERERGSNEGTLHVTSRDAQEGSYQLRFTPNAGGWQLIGGSLETAARAVERAETTSGVGDVMADIVSVVERFPEGITPKDLGVLMPKTNNIRTYLARAYESGRIQRLERGKYAPVPVDANVFTL